jgi:hypothetical protein
MLAGDPAAEERGSVCEIGGFTIISALTAMLLRAALK